MTRWFESSDSYPAFEIAIAGYQSASEPTQSSLGWNSTGAGFIDSSDLTGWTGKDGPFELNCCGVASTVGCFIVVVDSLPCFVKSGCCYPG